MEDFQGLMEKSASWNLEDDKKFVEYDHKLIQFNQTKYLLKIYPKSSRQAAKI